MKSKIQRCTRQLEIGGAMWWKYWLKRTLSFHIPPKFMEKLTLYCSCFHWLVNVFVIFNKTTWWVFDTVTIAGVCVPIMYKGTAETCEEESDTCFASGSLCCGGKTPSAATCKWLIGCAALPMMREKLTAAVEYIYKKQREGRLQEGEGEKSSDGRKL